MGICYQLIMEDEWNWGWSTNSKEDQLKEFEDKWDGYIERIAEWSHVVVYNTEKSCPYTDERKKLIRDYADRAYYRTDLGNGITEITLPIHTSTVQTGIDGMYSRRTPEQKKASEDACRERLAKMVISYDAT